MNRFQVFSCVDFEEDGYDGPVVALGCVADPTFMLFFPITKEQGKVINYVLNSDEEYDINSKVLGIYKTMLDSWSAGDRFLSGVIMDSVYDPEDEEDILMIRIALSDHTGSLDSLVRVNFLHAILLASMERADIIVSDSCLARMMPHNEDDDNEKRIHKKRHNPKEFPEDKDIIGIAKKIMSGKIKDNKGKTK